MKKFKIFKTEIYFLSRFLSITTIFVALSCNNNQQKQITDIPFLGDPSLSLKNYFKKLSTEEGEEILREKNGRYLNEYTNYKNVSLSLGKNISIKIIKEKSLDINKIKVNLYTFKEGEKIDSIGFYRNISGDEFGLYNCLSYLSKMENKIWQVKYFPTSPNPRSYSPGIISYVEMRIDSEGKIKSDSFLYLDEYLDAEMEKYSLYY